MKKINSLVIGTLAIAIFSCNNSDHSDTNGSDSDSTNIENNQKVNDSTSSVLKGDKISLREVVGSPTFDDTKFTIESPKNGAEVEGKEVTFNFGVSGGDFTLGTQTSDAPQKKCSNSQKGQHVHLIIDNKPYKASYTKEFKAEVEEGNHVALAFISRSYHESLKHEGAADVIQFSVGESEESSIDLNAPHLFYSRPKGEYNVKDNPEVFLDFYLVNTKIGEGGNYVKVTIDGEEFKVTKWAPYYMDGLEVGKHMIKIQLYDENDHYIEGPFNTEEREITIIN